MMILLQPNLIEKSWSLRNRNYWHLLQYLYIISNKILWLRNIMWNNNWESYQVKNDLYTTERCLEITRKHRNIVLNIMKVFCDKVKYLWKNHDKDKEIPENLQKYTYLLNHQQEPEINEEWRQIHNCNNTHHIEWFLNCKEPKLQYLVEMVCDQVAAAIARDAKYNDIFEDHKKRYMKKWLSEELAIICAHTFVDLRNSVHENTEKGA